MSSRMHRGASRKHTEPPGRLGFRSANLSSGPTTPFSFNFLRPPVVGTAPSRGCPSRCYCGPSETNQCSPSRPSPEARMLVRRTQTEVEHVRPPVGSLPRRAVPTNPQVFASFAARRRDAEEFISHLVASWPCVALRCHVLWPGQTICRHQLPLSLRPPPDHPLSVLPDVPTRRRSHGVAHPPLCVVVRPCLLETARPTSLANSIGAAVLPTEAITMSWLGRAAPATTHHWAWHTRLLAAQNRQTQAHPSLPTNNQVVCHVPGTRVSSILPPARPVLSNGAQDAGRKRLIRRGQSD
ncbi:hypothetical protein F5X68DRAFT_29744 [Plectosphaerella plurivora]|uniref:Uncharacterized protein n=1 Tax=Plectosphaerella plurivora TaxID=936078 RepID=A0A9P8VLQ7_9PEZI|nr:hypothetical protein F5X68DRAFT_29744 [Plectosphaerella plurivora]